MYISELPRRRAGLLSRDLGEEIVVVDLRTERVHALSGGSAALWRASLDPGASGLSALEASAALDVLAKLELIEHGGLTRRSLLVKGAVVTAVAGAGVLSTQLPSAAAGASVLTPTSAAATSAGNHTFTITPTATTVAATMTLAGGGGGGGSFGNTPNDVDAGQVPAIVTASLSFTAVPGVPIVLSVTVGAGGGAGVTGTIAGGSGYAMGGSGLLGGGGGGGSTSVSQTTTPLLVAAGGGGGGAAGTGVFPPPTTPGLLATAMTAGTNATGGTGGMSGAGGGGGAGAMGVSGGTGGTSYRAGTPVVAASVTAGTTRAPIGSAGATGSASITITSGGTVVSTT